MSFTLLTSLYIYYWGVEIDSITLCANILATLFSNMREATSKQALLSKELKGRVMNI